MCPVRHGEVVANMQLGLAEARGGLSKGQNAYNQCNEPMSWAFFGEFPTTETSHNVICDLTHMGVYIQPLCLQPWTVRRTSQEDRNKARQELQGILQHHFPGGNVQSFVGTPPTEPQVSV